MQNSDISKPFSVDIATINQNMNSFQSNEDEVKLEYDQQQNTSIWESPRFASRDDSSNKR